MAKECTVNLSKLRRGMVFWYDPNPEIDKSNVPPKIVDGHPIKDYTMYGERPYVVVSSDAICRLGRVVQVCPIGTKSDNKDNFPYDVSYNSFSDTGVSVIKCGQIRTVNSAELFKYECMLDDDIMDQVEDRLKELLGLSETQIEVQVPLVAMTPEEVEDLVDDKILQSKEETTSMIDAAVARILNGITSALSTKSIAKLLPDDSKSSTKVKRPIIVQNVSRK